MPIERNKKGPLRIILREQNELFNLKGGYSIYISLEKKILDGLELVKIEPNSIPATNPKVTANYQQPNLTIKIDQGYPLHRLNGLKLPCEEFYKKYKTYLKLVVR